MLTGLPQRTFWKSALLGSKTGNFSFWLGKNHVVGVSGEAARKMYLDHRDMDHIKGVVLIGHGPDYINGRSTTQHGIWLPVMVRQNHDFFCTFNSSPTPP